MAVSVEGGESSSTLNIQVNTASAVVQITNLDKAMLNMANNYDKQMARMESSSNRALRIFETAFSLAGKIFAAFQVKSFIDKMIEVNTIYTSFIATMMAVRGTMAAGRAEYDYILQVSQKLGISLEASINQYGRLAASMRSVDVTGEMTRHIFESVAVASTVLHLRTDETARIFLALEQAASKGKVSLEEFQRQLGNAIPGAIADASEGMNMFASEFRAAITKGSLNVYEVILRMTNEWRKKYADSLEYAVKTFQAQMMIFQNAVFNTFVKIGQSGAMDGLSKVVIALTTKLQNTQFIESIGVVIGEIGEQIGSFIDKISDDSITTFVMGISAALESVVTILKAMVESFTGLNANEDSVMDFFHVMARSFIASAEAAWYLQATVKDVAGAFELLGRTAVSVLIILTHGWDAAVENFKRMKELASRPSFTDAYNPFTGAAESVDANFERWRQRAREINRFGQSTTSFVDMNRILYGENQPIPGLGGAPYVAPTGSPSPSRIGMPRSDAEMAALLASGNINNMGTGTSTKLTPYDRQYLALMKDLTKAQNEFTNAQDGTFAKVNAAQAQLENLLQTDERFIKLKDEEKDKLREVAAAIDHYTHMTRAATFVKEKELQIDEMMFQLSLEGAGAQRVRELTAAREIDLFFQKMMIGANAEEIAQLKQMSDTIKNDLIVAMREVQRQREGMIGAINGVKQGLREFIDEAADLQTTLNNFTGQTLNGFVDALANSLATGKDLWRSFADSVILEINRIVARIIVAQTVEGFLNVIGLGGFIGSGGGGGPNTSVGTGPAHSGGVIGYDSFPSRYSSPMAFMGAPRYHSGGIVGDEKPIIAKRGEGVFTPGQMAALGRGTVVQVINQTGAPARQEVSKMPDGRELVKIIVGELSRDTNENGPFSRNLAQTFGLRRETVRR